ncbi:MAG TPA: hypothetical protein VNI54_04205 [Thermoanaerobaculia bacterium]|nr:hypothetical protein [Thermoanaerobaculia bacterium]
MKKIWMLVSAALVIGGIVAIVSVNRAEKNADRANDWTQVSAKIDQANGSMVTVRYESGGSTRRMTVPATPGATYSTGESRVIYVNPSDPMDVLLELPPRPPTWPMTAGVVSIVVGAILFGYFLREASMNPSARKKTSGEATGGRRRPAPPLARLQPPPGAKWKREDDE